MSQHAANTNESQMYLLKIKAQPLTALMLVFADDDPGPLTFQQGHCVNTTVTPSDHQHEEKNCIKRGLILAF